MRAVRLIAILALGILLAPFVATAQQPEKVSRIGFLQPSSPPPALLEAFRQGLRDAGYVEGQNILIEYRHADGKFERLSGLAAELVRLKVDLIVTSGAPAAIAARQATGTIPIVMAQINDPVALGLVNSLAKPGGNITGLANLHGDLGAKQLELLREAVPRLSRLAILWNPTNPGAELIVRHMQHASGPWA